MKNIISYLESCKVCPKNCGVNRIKDELGACNIGRYSYVSNFAPHFGEEPCIKGEFGSGTIFFSSCNLSCVFCQNHTTSQEVSGRKTSPKVLSNMMLSLQDKGCHNINFVSPSHVVPQILEALEIAKDAGLSVPIVYNTSGYDSLEMIDVLKDKVDIYLVDVKFFNKDSSKRYVKASNYAEVVKKTLKKMQEQVGDLQLGSDGLAKKGVLIRHLIMPGLYDESREIIDFISEEISPNSYINLMGHYRPEWQVTQTDKYPEINKKVPKSEYQLLKEYILQKNLNII